MALVIDATAGGASSNCYTTLSDAGVFLEQNIHTYAEWDALSDNDKSACLIMATRLLDEQVDWIGSKKTEAQALAWPRQFVYNPEGYSVDDSTIPDFLANATAEFGRHLALENRLAENATLGFSKIQVSSIDLRIKRTDRKKIIPKVVWSMINAYGVKANYTNRLVRC
ncbi:MAG: hypothetical protein AMK71_04130 [Nitrospira bacterium SG8_35_4]|nr:MAG: hypothetical protein AMK71_04130 [Nitrospira bacterium SG8_35_4]